MQGIYLTRGMYPQAWLQSTVQFIQGRQRPDGAIPWFDGGHADPWNHTEAAMGLSVGGAWRAAERAYHWLAEQQRADGSWHSAYRLGAVDQAHAESNFCAYPAVGVWHHYTISQNRDFLDALWPAVDRATDFVVDLQTPHGDIAWAVDGDGLAVHDSLLAGCCSIYKSLECALALADILGCRRPRWQRARQALGDALRDRPERFDRRWPSKRRFAMDWFYPVLTGAVTGRAARERLSARWHEFVIDREGCRCVDDEPWVAAAESCELVMALLAAGEAVRAREVYSWLHRLRAAQGGGYWTGYQIELGIHWPAEQTTWTAGAVLLAADALTSHTPACHLFTGAPLRQRDQRDAPALSAAQARR